jgi:hypothetical protein
MERGGKSAPSNNVPVGWSWLVDLYWNIKRFLPDASDPITPALIADYGVELSWQERELIFEFDVEIRAALIKQRAENDRWQMEKGKRG